MSKDIDKTVRMTSESFEFFIQKAKEDGFLLAVECLFSAEADELHEMYASGFGEWLIKNKTKILGEYKCG